MSKMTEGDGSERKMVHLIGVVPTTFSFSGEQRTIVNETMSKLAKKLGDKIGVGLTRVDVDLINNQEECDHELAIKDGKVYCVHCLKSFKVVENFEGGFIDSK